MSKSFDKKSDPHHEREAQQYEHPVPSREYILQYLEKRGRPTTFKHLVVTFELAAAEEKEGLRRRLIAMSRDGQIISNRRGSFALVSKMDLIRGRIQAHRDGFGFLIPDDGSDDIFLPAREVRGVFTDDVVLVRIMNGSQRRREGVIVEVLERNTHQVVGRYIEEDGVAFVDPDNKLIPQDIVIQSGQQGKAKSGDFVIVEITAQPTRRRQPTGKVLEVLGNQLTPGMEVELAIRSHNLPFVWSDSVKQEAQHFEAEVQEHDKEDREDLRKLPFVTIDGIDAKDFDDAVYCEKIKGKGWVLYVAIADVSHYVKPGTALDQEAQLRGNSVYFPARVIPMLPETLSNGLCSLKPQVDRLALVCRMEISTDGLVESYTFDNAVIHSHARLTYAEVAAMLDGEKTENHRMLKYIKPLHQLFKKLLRQRQLRGALDFDTVETRVVFDDKGKIDRIVPQERNIAHRIIEEAMLAANVCAGEFITKAKMPSLYRIHELPKDQKLLALRDFLKPFGLRLTGGAKPTALDYSKLLDRIHKRKDARLLQTVCLRSMRQAIYSVQNEGHFGLAYDVYTHFTSPIRRYPDLLVHRAIKHLLAKKKKNEFQYDKEAMVHFAEHCSTTERRADRATREALDWLKCEYMQTEVGKEFSGRIVEVTGFGVFVELDDIYVQGLVHITALKNDYYHYDAIHHLLRGTRGNKVYRLGDPMRVLVARVNLDDRVIDFESIP